MTVIRHEGQVPLSAAGRRFDQALAEMFPDYSRSRLAAWIKAGSVTLDGVNIVKRHLKATGPNQQSGIVERPAPIHHSNVMLIDP